MAVAEEAARAAEDSTAFRVPVGLVGAGFIAYGVFCAFRARYARL